MVDSEADVELVSGYADFQRSSMAIGVGSVVGGKYSKLEQILRAQNLSPGEKFLQSVQFICNAEEIPYDEPAYQRIVERHPYPQYLNAKACVYAVAYMLTRENTVIDDIAVQTKERGLDIKPLDLYRYAVLISDFLRNV